MADTKYYTTIGEVIDDMDGSNWAVTEAQCEGIRDLCRNAQIAHKNALRRVLALAYEAGRKHDRAAYGEIESDINGGAYNLMEVQG